MDKQNTNQQQITQNEVFAELQGLKDLFQRRLIDDKVKTKIIEDLQQTTSDSQNLPLFRELIQLLDRIEAQYMGTENPFIQSITEELLMILSHFGVEVLQVGSKFDPNTQKVVEVVKDGNYENHTVLRIARSGYSINGRILRATEVIVSRERTAQKVDSLSVSLYRESEV
ncbi:hypothetical protein FACS1894125_2400 [Actinomycetota bacterium]|nr:hypothetical protein FACS1894125_2400 [Actinomycetota bacterium]